MSDAFRWCGDSLAHWAKERGDSVAITDPLVRLTYAELDRVVDETVSLFREMGVVPGDRVLVVCENSAAAGVALTAAQRMRAWAAPVNARMTAAEIHRIAEHCRPRIVVVTDGISEQAKAHGATFGASQTLPVPGAHGASWPDAGEPEPVEDDPARQVAALMYTTGTTGPPKGVMLTHDNLIFVARQIGLVRGQPREEHVYCVLPISHIYGLGAVLGTALHHGYRVDFVPRFDPAAVLRALAEDGVTSFSGVPAMHAALCALGEKVGIHAPTLRFIGSGGAPLDPGLKARVERLFGLPLGNGYGLTETSPIGATTPHGVYEDSTSAGPVFPGIELRIAGPEGEALPPQDVGEVWIRGRCIMRGYYKAPDLTAQAITADGWFRTGDLGRLDERGWLSIAGRLKELIIRSGFNVYPPEIEGVLTKHPSVALAAVVGRKAADGNEEVVAFVQPKPGMTVPVAELEAMVAEALAPYKHPAEYHVFEALPAAATGKLLKHKLLELLEKQDGA